MDTNSWNPTFLVQEPINHHLGIQQPPMQMPFYYNQLQEVNQNQQQQSDLFKNNQQQLLLSNRQNKGNLLLYFYLKECLNLNRDYNLT